MKNFLLRWIRGKLEHRVLHSKWNYSLSDLTCTIMTKFDYRNFLESRILTRAPTSVENPMMISDVLNWDVKQNINLIIGFYFLQVQKIWKDETKKNGLGPSQTPGGTKFLVFAVGHFSNTKVVLFDVTKSFFDIFFQYMYH